MTIDFFYPGLLQASVLAMVGFGLMIPFRFLKTPDLTAEGTYPLGAVVYAIFLLQGYPQFLCLGLAGLAGGFAAFCVSQVAIHLKVHFLLSGIILSTMIYSLNLRLMGKPNIPIFHIDAFSFGIFSLFFLGLFLACLFFLFLKTDFGLRFRAAGLHPKFSLYQGISVNRYTHLGFFMAGSTFGLAGAFMTQIQQFVDVGMGMGIALHGLASLMIGESLLGRNNLPHQLLSPWIGAVIYQQIQGFVLFLGLHPSDLKFFTGAFILLIFSLQQEKR